MKNIVLILWLCLMSTTVVRCQNANILGAKDYNNIKINNVNLIDIKKTGGNTDIMKKLFGKPMKIEKDDDPIYGGYIMSIDYYYKNLEISFYEKELSNIDIVGNKSSVKIKGKTVTIGDNISKLGKVIFNKKNDNTRGILYMECKDCNSFIYIDFDQKTKRITKIGYIEQT